LPESIKEMVATDSDIQEYNEAERLLREGVDVITSGFPCQDISVAGRKEGIQFDRGTLEASNRSGLFGQALRTVRLVRPRRWIMENVAAIYDGFLGLVLGQVAESGYDAQWDCLSSGRLGRRHLRERFYAVAYTDCERLQGGQLRMQEDTGKGNILAALLPTLPLRQAAPEDDLPKPYIVGKDDGIPNRAHRIKSLGNTIDPELAELIGKMI
jgi:DNA (cytosine-5)-methyltransferase 1